MWYFWEKIFSLFCLSRKQQSKLRCFLLLFLACKWRSHEPFITWPNCSQGFNNSIQFLFDEVVSNFVHCESNIEFANGTVHEPLINWHISYQVWSISKHRYNFCLNSLKLNFWKIFEKYKTNFWGHFIMRFLMFQPVST